MDCLLGFAGQIAGQIMQSIFTPIGNHIGYAIYYREKIEKLKSEMGQLGRARRSVQVRVESATNIGERVRVDVLNWLENSEHIEREVNEFLESLVQGENQRWYSCYFRGCSCPNFRSRYLVGKEAKEKIVAIVRVKDIRNLDPVAHPVSPSEFGATSATNVSEDFKSRVLVFEKIMDTLKEDGIRIIGVYGMGGVGKTRMVEEVGKQAKAGMMFDKVVMAVASQTPDVRKIQGQLADGLSFKLGSETEMGRAGELCKRLKNGKKILVIIDDVWEEINLKEIGIPYGDKSCKIVLTSRKQGVCLDMKVQKYFQIGELLDSEAWALFKKKVGSHIEYCPPEMYSVAQQVCRECGGLPLAILAVGATLMKYNDERVWNDVLEQLKNSELSNIEGVSDKVVSSLKLSYDYLEPTDAKSCFLLCSLFPEDAQIPLEGLLRYGMGMGMVARVDTIEKTRNKVHTLVNILKASCCLLDGKNKNFVKMHDIIRDVALSITANNKQAFLVKTSLREWPSIDSDKCYSAISFGFEDNNALPDDFECPNLYTLLLDFKSSPSAVEIPSRFFNGMGQLRVLDLTNMSLLPHLPSSFHNLVNLQMLCLHECKLADMSMLKELKKLQILTLRGSYITELPQQIRYLTCLRLLDLRTAKNLPKVIPPQVISGLSHLEELYISDMFEEWESNITDEGRSNTFLVELNSLPHLIDLRIHINNVDILPDDMVLFRKLIRFQISMGKSITGPEKEISASSTRKLKLRDVPLKDGAKILMAKADQLYLENVTGLKEVHQNRHTEGFLDLKELIIHCCEDVEHLFSKHDWVLQKHGPPLVPFCKLTYLDIYKCGLRYLFSPSIARGLVQLQFLSIESCKEMENLIGNEGDGDKDEVTDLIIFPQLRVLILVDLRNFISICPKLQVISTTGENPDPVEYPFNEMVAFPCLADLTIRGLFKWKEPWPSSFPTNSFGNLRVQRFIEF